MASPFDLGAMSPIGEVFTGPRNRAERRRYVKLNQTRAFRKGVYGFGRWRRHDEHGDHHEHARDTAVGGDDYVDCPDYRHMVRPERIAQAKAARRARLVPGWRRAA